jgi:hypothetical protein
MAVSRYYQVTAEQVQISRRIGDIIMQLMRGLCTSCINPSAAIPPANQGQYNRDAGIGTSLDISA